MQFNHFILLVPRNCADLKTHTFSLPTYINTGIKIFPKLKIISIQATISVSKDEEVIKIEEKTL